MRKIIRQCIFAALLFSSFSVWFAFNDYARLPFIFLAIAFLMSIFDKGKLIQLPRHTSFQKVCLIILLLIICISYLVNGITNPQPKLNSNFYGTVGIILFLYFCYSSLVEKYMSLDYCVKGLAYGGILLMAVIITDSLLVNFAGIEIADLFCFGKDMGYPYFNRGIWISSAAPTGEPAHSITFLNILMPFTFYFFKGKKRWIATAGYVFCLISSFSTTAIATVGLLPVILLFSNVSKRTKRYIMWGGGVLAFIFVTFLLQSNLVQDVLEGMQFIDKITMSGNTRSDVQRANGMTMAIEHGINSPLLGMGPGYGKSIDPRGYLSLFLTMLGCYGFVAFFVFLFFWLNFYFKIRRINADIRVYFLIAYSVCTIAAIINDNIHNFIIWALFPIINKAYNERYIIK